MAYSIIKLLLAALLALGLAWLWDHTLKLTRINQKLRIRFFIPVGEELIKLGFFYFLQLSPILFSGLFGLGEGLIESSGGPNRYKITRYKITVVLAGCFTHLIFSLFFLTAFPVYLKVLLAIGAHIWWNDRVLNQSIE